MFTGIVEELGTLRKRDGHRYEFEAETVIEDAKIGDSIAVNGCCLTVVDTGAGRWAADVVDESLSRTNLGGLQPGDRVNFERPLLPTGRFAGHLVQGHVDGVGEVISPAPDLTISIPPGLSRYIVEKGSITVDGCSLTVVEVSEDRFRVAVIPHTAEVTTLGLRQPGDQVNLEVDLIAKYVERLTETRNG